jgi:acyl carrier protein
MTSTPPQEPSPADQIAMESLPQRLRQLVLNAAPKLKSRQQEMLNDTPLFDLGIDSLDHAKILMTIEDHLNIEIDDEDINSLQSIDDLHHYCCQRIHSQA